MAKKVSKNQRTDRGKNRQDIKMAKIVFAQKKGNGNFSFRTRMVNQDNLKEALNDISS